MRDIGGLVWIVFVLFAVISSIVRSARRARGVPSSLNTVNRSSGTPTRTPVMMQFHQQAQVVMPPQPPPQAAPKPVPPPPPIVPAPQAAPPRPVVQPQPQPQRPVTRLFSDRAALVRGIVAAEVLGKPLALRDE